MLQTRFSAESLALSNVIKGFSSGDKPVTVLNEVSYEFVAGTSYAIVGASGSGKSTLLHVLAGFEPPTSGDVLWNGTGLDTFSEPDRDAFVAQHFGFIFQFHYLLKELTIYQNIEIAGMIQKMPAKASAEQVKQLLAKVGLEELEHRYPHQLSGGQQQRVAVARALMGNPQFLMADEPTGNLDEENERQIIELCLSYQKSHNMGMIIATHNPAVYERMDIILELHNGILQERA
jgi:ABC-type lipoprotein export system ATPase subunit